MTFRKPLRFTQHDHIMWTLHLSALCLFWPFLFHPSARRLSRLQSPFWQSRSARRLRAPQRSFFATEQILWRYSSGRAYRLIMFNPSLERHLQYEKEDEGRLLEWNRDLTRLETSPNKWHTIWPPRVQEHCSLPIGILDPSDQDSSWCPHTRRTSVGGGKHIPENERNIPSGYLT